MLIEFIISIITIFVVTFLIWTRNYDYWKAKNISYVPGSFPFGSIKDGILMRDNIGYILIQIYKQFEKAKLIGFYALWKPMLIVKDPELVKNVLARDFASFGDNGFEASKSTDPMMYLNPFGMKGAEEWKNLRNFHRPVYTANKIKPMVEKLWKTSGNFVKFLSNKNEELDILSLCRFYTTDSVALCAYSLESDSFNDPNSPFHEATSGQLFTSAANAAMSAFFAPFLTPVFGWKTVTEKAEHFFKAVGLRCMNHRREQNIQQNDLIQHIIATNEKRNLEGQPRLTDTEIAAACLVFFIDGSETSAYLLALTFYEIAANLEVQEKLREEIRSIGNSIEEFDFDKLWAMEYLEMVMTEAQRLHPPIPFITRLCTQDAELDGVKIEKGTKIFIPSLAIHLDDKYYHDPEKFDPERFSKERLNGLDKYTFLTFGEGPRICIGMKFAQTQLKMAIVAILLNYKISLGETHKGKKLEYDQNSYFVASILGDIWLRFEKI